MNALIPVLAAPLIDPGRDRVDLTVACGVAVADIVRLALPGATAEQLARCRVALVTPKGETIIPQEHWARVRPHAGVHVVIRLVPGKNALRSVLQILVAVAAVALGQFWAAPLSGALGISQATATGLIGLGVSAIGNLLINALVPPATADKDKQKPTFAISGFRNSANPDGPVPMLLGRHRVAPVFAAQTYTEIVGDLQYVRALFCFGYGPLTLSDLKIGDTLLSKYDEVQIELREGLPTDDPVTLYPQQVIEEQHGVDLLREYPRDDAGEILESSAPVDQPVTRFTASDASEVAVILGFPAGLVKMDDKGKKRNQTVSIRIRQRLVGVTPWTTITTLNITAKKTEALYRVHRWSLPARGRYEIELTRMTNEAISAQISDRSVWVAMQSFRPEYPLAFDKPLALAAVRVKATHQLNSALDNFNAMAALRCLDWDAATDTWILRETRNPASLYRYVLQGPPAAYPEPDSALDLAALADWHEYCTAKGLKYDRLHDFEASLSDVLAAVAAAGRASPRHDGRKWTVVIDRPRELVVDHISPRNARAFKWSRTYINPPHAFRVPFIDQTNDYQSGERIVPWPGHVGDITVTEELQLPGKTDPDEIWREARRRQYEIIHRPDKFAAIQDGAARVATRGDLVMGSWDVLQRTQTAARVLTVRGNLIELDDMVSMEAGATYACRFRAGIDDEDTVGISVMRTVATVPGESQAIRVTGSGELPTPGDILHFGPAATESLALIVSGVEPAEDFAAVYTMLAAAPIIDTLTDADMPPAWSGRVGASIGSGSSVPAVPVFAGVSTGGAGGSDLIVRLAPGAGSAVIVGSYELRHRLSGSGTWTTLTETAAAASFTVSGYTRGQMVDLSARAISLAAVASSYTATVTVEVGHNETPLPIALPSGSITVTGGLGGTTINFATGNDDALAQMQLYRCATGVTFNRATHAVGSPMPVSKLTTYTRIDGDGTRTTKIANGAFASAATWSYGTGWTFDVDKGTHVAGTAALISQTVSLTAGKTYRLQYTVLGRTAGSITPQLTGGTTVSGATVSANGTYNLDLVAVTGNTALAFSATSAFAGSIDDITLYEVTPTTLAAGTYDYYLEPQNDESVPGPVSGPFTTTVI